MNTITINGKTLLLVEMPIDAENIQITWSGDSITHPLLSYNIAGVAQPSEIVDFGATLLGTIHAEGKQIVFSEGFDPEPFIEDELVQDDNAFHGASHAWINYMDNTKFFRFHEPELSFLSLIQKETGKTFVNPLGEEPVYSEYVPAYLNDNFNKRNKEEEFEKDLEAWRAAESNVFKGKLAVILVTT